MVCRECGAYNAEHLTHCRVCAAKLRDDSAPSTPENTFKEQDGARPQREFAKAPSWPTRAYSGVVEKPVYNPPKSQAADSEEKAESITAKEEEPMHPYQPEVPEAAVKSAVSSKPATPVAPRRAESVTSKRVCSVCGREMLSDAPFCAYCGSHEGLPGAEGQGTYKAPAMKRPATGAAAAVAVSSAEERTIKKAAKPINLDEDFDDLYDDEDDIDGKKTHKADKNVKKALKKHHDEDFDLDDDDIDEDDDDYDDDDDLADMPGKRGKGTTLLFWVLIILLIALIGVFGAYIVKKNYGGDFNNLIAAITGKGGATTNPDDSAAQTGTTPADESKMYTAEIGTDVDATTGTPVYVIDVYAPTGSAVKVETTTELVNGGTTTIPSNNHVILHVPQAALLPNAPVDSTTITIKPKVTVTNPEGQTVDIDVPEVTAEAEALDITIESPTGESITNTFNNDPIKIVGRVADYTIGVFVNGNQTTVYEDGTFQADFTPKGGEEAETITIEARKNNCMTATKTITVEPFVMKDATLTVTNDVSVKGLELRSGSDGKVTIKGTTVPGATVTATSTNAKVTFDAATVSDAGEFQLPVTIGEGGVFTVNLKATAEGYTEASATCFVEKLPNDSSSSYKKASTSLKTEQHAAIVAGTTTTGDFVFTGTVTEIIAAEPYETVKMKLSSGEEVIVTNRSAKNRLETDDLNKKKTVAGSLVGLYEETGLPHLWIWYVWNA